MPTICDGNPKNELRPCPDEDGTCGTYHGKRFDALRRTNNFLSLFTTTLFRQGGRIVNGVDIKCRPGTVVHAPFDGDMYFWRPFGGRKGYDCSDKGARIEGTGQWQGEMVLSSVPVLKADFFCRFWQNISNRRISLQKNHDTNTMHWLLVVLKKNRGGCLNLWSRRGSQSQHLIYHFANSTGYFVLMASIELDTYGGKVKQGDPIGIAVSQACTEQMSGDFEEFVQMRLYRKGRLVDPTYHLQSCKCAKY